jgi:hypothetical protein
MNEFMYQHLVPNDLPLMHPGVPLAGCIFYALVLTIFWPRSQPKTKSSPSPLLKPFVLIHNLFLAIFSGYIFAMTAPQFYAQYIKYESFDIFLNESYQAEDWTAFAVFGWLFYLSKFYEFIDTFIVLVKGIFSGLLTLGGKPITLQIFHHLGAVTSMYVLVQAKVPGSMFILPNNFSLDFRNLQLADPHVYVYLLYAFNPRVGLFFNSTRYRPRWKMVMTLMQITQFIGGLGIAHYILYNADSYSTKQAFALSVTLTYVAIVLSMFCSFFWDTYFGKVGKVQVGSVDKVQAEKVVTPKVRRTPRKKKE